MEGDARCDCVMRYSAMHRPLHVTDRVVRGETLLQDEITFIHDANQIYLMLESDTLRHIMRLALQIRKDITSDSQISLDSHHTLDLALKGVIPLSHDSAFFLFFYVCISNSSLL